ncbi:MAG: glycosyltransferase family 2 protein [Candidatus Sulfotelmatobacter sp.]
MKIASQPLVSIVVPVYNEEEFLGECMDSILTQTYANWECTIVNNCSTDRSAAIAKRFASRDSRIRLQENQEFVRAVPNFNGALRQISPSSKYAKIVFSDDWIFPECLERMVEVAEQHPTAGVVGAYGLQGSDVMWAGLPYPSQLISGREVCRKLFLDDLYVFGTGTSLLFRADLVRARNPFYNESNLHADSETCCALLGECDFSFVHQVLTFTRVRDGSLYQFSRGMNTLIAGRLYDLVNFGRQSLTEQEFQSCLEKKLTEYYRFLAAHVVRRYDREFWEYHKRKLVEVGVGFDRTRLTRALCGKFADAALNPKQALDKFLSRKRSQKPAVPALDASGMAKAKGTALALEHLRVGNKSRE